MKHIHLHYENEKFEKLKEKKASQTEWKNWEDFVFYTILNNEKRIKK